MMPDHFRLTAYLSICIVPVLAVCRGGARQGIRWLALCAIQIFLAFRTHHHRFKNPESDAFGFSIVFAFITGTFIVYHNGREEAMCHLHKLNKEAEEARVQALSAARLRSDFVSRISHEIRTPLHGCLGMLTVLKDTPLNAAQAECVDVASLSAQSLMAVLDSILLFARNEKEVEEGYSGLSASGAMNPQNGTPTSTKFWQELSEKAQKAREPEAAPSAAADRRAPPAAAVQAQQHEGGAGGNARPQRRKSNRFESWRLPMELLQLQTPQMQQPVQPQIPGSDSTRHGRYRQQRQGGGKPRQFSAFSPTAMLERAARAVAPYAQQRGLSLVVDVSAALPASVLGDCSALSQAVLHLLGNAVKFTPTGRVLLAADARELPLTADNAADTGGENEAEGKGDRQWQLCVWVQDTGVGVDPAQAAKVFDSFAQGSPRRASAASAGAQGTEGDNGGAFFNPSRRVRGGIGLGLSIARQVAQLHGGDVTLETEGGAAQQPGSTFKLTAVLQAPVSPTRGGLSGGGSAAGKAAETKEEESPDAAAAAGCGSGSGSAGVHLALLCTDEHVTGATERAVARLGWKFAGVEAHGSIPCAVAATRVGEPAAPRWKGLESVTAVSDWLSSHWLCPAASAPACAADGTAPARRLLLVDRTAVCTPAVAAVVAEAVACPSVTVCSLLSLAKAERHSQDMLELQLNCLSRANAAAGGSASVVLRGQVDGATASLLLPVTAAGLRQMESARRRSSVGSGFDSEVGYGGHSPASSAPRFGAGALVGPSSCGAGSDWLDSDGAGSDCSAVSDSTLRVPRSLTPSRSLRRSSAARRARAASTLSPQRGKRRGGARRPRSSSNVTPDDAAALAARFGPPMHLLVVDDNAVNRRVCQRLLERQGHRVDTADSGQAALDMLQPQLSKRGKQDCRCRCEPTPKQPALSPPSFQEQGAGAVEGSSPRSAPQPCAPHPVTCPHFAGVLMDLHMPGMSGLDATRAIRQQAAAEGVPRLPVVALTADASLREACADASMDGFFTKPFVEHTLANAVSVLREAMPQQRS